MKSEERNGNRTSNIKTCAPITKLKLLVWIILVICNSSSRECLSPDPYIFLGVEQATGGMGSIRQTAGGGVTTKWSHLPLERFG